MPGESWAFLLADIPPPANDNHEPLDYEDFDPAVIPLFDESAPLDVATIMELLTR